MVAFSINAQVISLNGTWNFKADYYNKGATQNWYGIDFSDLGWDKMQVPGNWDIRNEYAEFAGKGWYRTSFETPAGITGKVVLLNFEAVGIDYKVWLNGEQIAHIMGGYFSTNLNITGKLNNQAKNTLVVCADNTFRSGAYWSWGGIRRPVSLVINNPLYIQSVKVVANPDLKKGTAVVRFSVEVFNENKIKEQVELHYEISFAGKSVHKITKKITLTGSEINETSVELLLLKKEVKLWHFDFPNLYTIKIQLKKGKLVQHEMHDRFGIRKVEISAGKFLLNGESIRAMGANWVADDRLTGNTLSPDIYKRDIDNMKSMGVNITRLSHLPLPKEVYDYLDEKGMLIIAEIPLWGITKLADPENPVPQQWIKQLVNNNFNHPSIIGWCVGNEISNKTQNPHVMEYTEKAIRYVKDSLDNLRLVILVSLSANYQPVDPSKFGDFVPYNSYNNHAKNIDKVHEYQPDKIIFMSEVGNSLIGEDLNTSTGNFSKMFNEIRGRSYLFGASLWTYNDYRSNYRSSDPTWDSKVSQNRDWGVVDGYGNKKRAYNIVRKEYAPLKSLTVKTMVDLIEVGLQSREKLDLPAYPMHEYKLVCEEFGKDYQLLKKKEQILPLINPGDSFITKTFVLKDDLSSVSARKISLVSPTDYTLMDTTLYYVAPEKPVIKAVFNDGVKVRVIFDPVHLATEYKLLYGEKELDKSSVNTIDNYIELDKLPGGESSRKIYQLQLVAVNSFGETGSTLQQVTLTGHGKLPPIIKAIKAFQNGFSIGYSSVKGEYLYKVQYATTPDFSGDVQEIQTVSKGACYVPDLKAGSTYYVRMMVYEQFEIKSPWSETWSVKL